MKASIVTSDALYRKLTDSHDPILQKHRIHRISSDQIGGYSVVRVLTRLESTRDFNEE